MIFLLMFVLTLLDQSSSFVCFIRNTRIHRHSKCAASLTSTPDITNTTNTITNNNNHNDSIISNSKERSKKSRPARRMNHNFQYLYRHQMLNSELIAANNEVYYRDNKDFLTREVGYENVDAMIHDFPPLAYLDIDRHLMPKFKFCKFTLKAETVHFNDLSIPPQFFGTRLERTIAPFHGFLEACHLPSGSKLLENNGTLLKELLVASTNTKSFVRLCNQWRTEYPTVSKSAISHIDDTMITIRDVDQFVSLFARGLMPATRNENKELSIDPGVLIELLVNNGANPLERDYGDRTLIHWASGAGNISAVLALVPYFGGMQKAIYLETGKDKSLPLHWAACGADQKNFGIGGNISICKMFLEASGATMKNSHSDHSNSIEDMEYYLGNEDADTLIGSKLVDSVTADGNSVLMWAAWSGSFDVVKLLLEYDANVELKNKNGCSVAHWAASGGNLEVCKYLHQAGNVDFNVVNFNGNSPLSHAVAFGRRDVVFWLYTLDSGNGDDGRAAELAKDIVEWGTSNDGETRKEIMNAFLDMM